MSDDFSARYRLLKCVAVDGGIRTHSAQELATGRPVMVHVADTAGPEDVEILRARLARLSGPHKNRVLETATLASGFAIVTEFVTGLKSFQAWLDAQVPDDSHRRPVPVTAATPFAPTAPVDSIDPVDPFVQAAPPPAPTPVVAHMPRVEPVAKPQVRGEFTQLFGGGGAPPPLADFKKETPLPPPPAVTAKKTTGASAKKTTAAKPKSKVGSTKSASKSGAKPAARKAPRRKR